MKYKVEYFRKTEFVCPCCGKGHIVPMLAYSLDMLRRAWNMPILVNSAWRCPEHNVKVGGAKQSRHMIGCAADIRPKDLTLIGPFQTLIGYMFGRQEGWEVRMYPRFVHLAVPREEAVKEWNGGVITLHAA